MSWEEIAKRVGVTGRQARSDYRSFVETLGDTGPDDPVELVDNLLRGFQADLWEFTEAADTAWEQQNVSGVVAAVRSRMDARAKIMELLQATNKLPKNLGTLRVERDVRFMIEVVVGVFDEFEVPAEAKRVLLERLEPQALEPAA